MVIPTINLELVMRVEKIAQLEAEIRETRNALQELSGLCERAWKDCLVGKPARNQAKRVLEKYSIANAQV